MRIKSDFVTNSSSTAYIILIPDNFHFSENEILLELEKIDPEYFEYEPTEEDKKKVIEAVHHIAEELKCGNEVWKEYDNEEEAVDMSAYDITLELCDTHGFSLNSIEMGSSGMENMVGIDTSKIEKIITENIDMFSIFNMLQRNCKNEKE